MCFYGIDFGSNWDERRAKLDSVKKSVETGIFMQSVNEPDGFSYNYGGVNYLLTWSDFLLLNWPDTFGMARIRARLCPLPSAR